MEQMLTQKVDLSENLFWEVNFQEFDSLLKFCKLTLLAV